MWIGAKFIAHQRDWICHTIASISLLAVRFPIPTSVHIHPGLIFIPLDQCKLYTDFIRNTAVLVLQFLSEILVGTSTSTSTSTSTTSTSTSTSTSTTITTSPSTTPDTFVKTSI